MKASFRILILLLAAVTSVFALAGCEHRLSSSTPESSEEETISYEIDKSQSFLIALYPEYAPIACENFEKLVSEGFYDGLYFHRIYEDFMAQGGNGAYAGKTADTIKGEFAANGIENKLGHKRGTVSMARRGNDYDSASSQFFIVYSETHKSSLDGYYAAFGEVIEGMEVVDSFLTVPLTQGSDEIPTVPTEPITIIKGEIEGKDADGHTLCRFYVHVGY